MRVRTQTVRLLDVYVVGPMVFWGGIKAAQDGESLRGGLLMLLGTLTIGYNGANYITRNRLERRSVKGVDPRELRRGVQVEMEHTDDPEEARVIALDHLLNEDSHYYTKLTRAGL